MVILYITDVYLCAFSTFYPEFFSMVLHKQQRDTTWASFISATSSYYITVKPSLFAPPMPPYTFIIELSIKKSMFCIWNNAIRSNCICISVPHNRAHTQTQSNVRIYFQPCFWAPGECKSDICPLLWLFNSWMVSYINQLFVFDLPFGAHRVFRWAKNSCMLLLEMS